MDFWDLNLFSPKIIFIDKDYESFKVFIFDRDFKFGEYFSDVFWEPWEVTVTLSSYLINLYFKYQEISLAFR